MLTLLKETEKEEKREQRVRKDMPVRGKYSLSDYIDFKTNSVLKLHFFKTLHVTGERTLLLV